MQKNGIQFLYYSCTVGIGTGKHSSHDTRLNKHNLKTATELAPTRGRPNAGGRGINWQTRRLNSLKNFNVV